MSNRQLEEQAERDSDQKVATYLGLTYDEYLYLQPSVEEMAGDDGLIYGYLVTFETPVPADLAAKMSGLNDGEVALPPGFFDTEEQDPEWPQG